MPHRQPKLKMLRVPCNVTYAILHNNAKRDSRLTAYGTVAQKGQSQISYKNTKQFPKTQINFSKHEPVCQNTKQFRETQIYFPKHKLFSQNTNQFLKTRTSLPKHKPISRNTNQFRETQILRHICCYIFQGICSKAGYLHKEEKR